MIFILSDVCHKQSATRPIPLSKIWNTRNDCGWFFFQLLVKIHLKGKKSAELTFIYEILLFSVSGFPGIFMHCPRQRSRASSVHKPYCRDGIGKLNPSRQTAGPSRSRATGGYGFPLAIPTIWFYQIKTRECIVFRRKTFERVTKKEEFQGLRR